MQSQMESPGLRLREGGGGMSIVKAEGGQSMRSHLQQEPWDLLPLGALGSPPSVLQETGRMA